MSLLDFLFGPGSKRVKRTIEILTIDGKSDVKIIHGENVHLSDQGSIDRVIVKNLNFHPTCGCLIDTESAGAGMCSLCKETACLNHFAQCNSCGRSLCNLHSKRLDSDSADSDARVCFPCADWDAPKKIALKMIEFLDREH